MEKFNYQASVGCLVRYNGKILVVYEHQRGRTCWDIPAGSIEAGETPEQAVKRELWEEVGIRAHAALDLVKIFWAKGQTAATIHFLYQLDLDKLIVQKLKPHTTDIQRIELFSQEQVRDILDNKAYEHELAKQRFLFFLEDGSLSPGLIQDI